MAKHAEVKIEMMIRRPAQELYESFVDPKRLAKFWLSQASERLEVGRKILWKFKIKGAEDTIEVKALEPNKRILISWGDGVEVEWTFRERGSKETMVTIKVDNIQGNADAQLSYAVDVTQGFTIVLMELKGHLEHGIALNGIYDKFPDAEHI